MSSTSSKRTDYTALWDQVYGGKPLLTLMWGASGFKVKIDRVNNQAEMVFLTKNYTIKTRVYPFDDTDPLISSKTIYCVVTHRGNQLAEYDNLTQSLPSIGADNPLYMEENVRWLEYIFGKSLTF